MVNSIYEQQSRSSPTNTATLDCEDMNITVSIPRHCSAISSLPRVIFYQRSPERNKCTSTQQTRENAHNAAETTTRMDMDVLYIQCHLDRIVWNFLQPLFEGESNNESAINAIQILLFTFRHYIHQADEASRLHHSTTTHKNVLEQLAVQEKTEPAAYIDQDPANTLWTKTCYKFRLANVKAEKYTTIIILPPYPALQKQNRRHDNLYTEQIFTSVLVNQENLNIRLQTLNAFVATMGGGYFLCRFLSTAVRLAQYQRRIAVALNDVQLVMKCTINEAYNYIHAGKIDIARLLIKTTKKAAKRRRDELILGMCQSANWFATKVGEAALKEMELDNGRQATNDDFLRIRVVRNRCIAESSAGGDPMGF